MITPMHSIEETRGLPKRCSCGRFYVRRIIDRNGEGERVEIDKSQAIGHIPGFCVFKKSRPAADGQCERCATYGPPDYAETNTVGSMIRHSMRRGRTYKSTKALLMTEEQWSFEPDPALLIAEEEND